VSQELNDEFEEYVKKLTVEISKEIFLKHLQDLYNSYDDNLKNTLEVSANLREAVRDLSAGIQAASNTALQTKQDSISSLKKIEKQIQHVEAETESLFKNMRKVNESDRKAMLDDLRGFSKSHADTINQVLENSCGNIADDRKKILDDLTKFSKRHTNTIKQILENSCNNIDERLSKIVTADQLQQLQEVMEQNTQSAQELADCVNNALADKAEENIKHFQEALDNDIQTQMERVKDQLEATVETIEKTLKTQKDTFSDAIAAAGDEMSKRLQDLLQDQKEELERALTEQAKRIRQACPDKESVKALVSSAQEIETIAGQQKSELESGRKNLDKADKRIQDLEESVNKFVSQVQENDKRLNELVTEQQEQLKQAEENCKAQKLFVQCSSTLTFILLALLLFYQEPSFFWGIALIVSAFVIWCFNAKKKE